jgi:hypothetical protein
MVGAGGGGRRGLPLPRASLSPAASERALAAMITDNEKLGSHRRAGAHVKDISAFSTLHVLALQIFMSEFLPRVNSYFLQILFMFDFFQFF